MAAVRCGINAKSVVFEHMLQIKLMVISLELAPMWIPQDTFDKSVTAWRCQQAITCANVDLYLCHHVAS